MVLIWLSLIRDFFEKGFSFCVLSCMRIQTESITCPKTRNVVLRRDPAWNAIMNGFMYFI